MSQSQPDPEPPPVVVDHPARLDRLAEVFERRNIAMAADADGRLVLVRPDSVLVDAGDPVTEAETFRQLLERLAEVDAELARTLREVADDRIARRLVRLPVRVPERAEDRDGEPRWSVAEVDRVVLTLRAVGIRAEPNHVMLGSQIIKGSPVGTEAHFAAGMMFTAETRDSAQGPVLLSSAEPAPRPRWLRPPLGLPTVPHVLVLDTGLRTVDAAGTTVEHDELGLVALDGGWTNDPTVGAVDHEDEPDDDATGFLDFEAGHGTFISGIVRQICPDAVVHVAGVLSSFGDGDVLGVIETFEQALARAERSLGGRAFDLVVMSFGGYMAENDGAIFGAALLSLLGDGVGIAAAGNQATSRPYFPAAHHGIIGVGALGEDGKAWFSNFGGWVDACAPAIDVVSTFFQPYVEQLDGEPGRRFDGWARWSGTSFAAPKVAAVLAQEMHLTGCTARQAWTRLSDHQRYRYPDLGTVFNV